MPARFRGCASTLPGQTARCDTETVSRTDPAIRVLIAEDSYLVREGVRTLIGSDPGVDVVACCEDADELLERVRADGPDVVLTDIRMPPTGTDEGIRAAETLREIAPDVGVVVLSQHDEPEYALRLLEHGSAGRAYLLKDSLADAAPLLSAIREVAAGGSVIDPRVVESLVTSRRRDAASPIAQLTPRELDVLSAMAEGATNIAIAQQLFLSVRVVEKHINALFAKLGLGMQPDVHRRVRAVLIYLAAVEEVP